MPSKPEQAAAPEDAPSARGLRIVLIIGFCGIAVIFLVAMIDALSLLAEMRAESQTLREGALARAHQLDSIRSTIILSQSYLGEYFLYAGQPRSRESLAKMQESCGRARSGLTAYHASTAGEEALVRRVEVLLDEAAQDGEVPRLTGSMVEIVTNLESIDNKQEAAAEARIQSEFERAGTRLRRVLALALVSVLVLAGGCLFYISRIEGQNRRRYEEILQGRKALEQLSARLREAQETERRAISRELHDQVGQSLNALLVDAGNLARRVPRDDVTGQRYLDSIKNLADSSVNAIRDIAQLLRPSMLDDLGLIPALEWQAREVSRRTGIKVEVVAENVPDRLSDQVRTCIFRVVQEALQNVSRHSGAKTAVITVRDAGGSLFLSVIDDGRGFDPERTRGMGMLGIEERIRQLGGRFEVESAPGRGTTLRATLPMEAVGSRV